VSSSLLIGSRRNSEPSWVEERLLI